MAAAAVAPAAHALSSTPDAPGYTVNGTVRAIVRLGDVIYFGGSFSSVNGSPRTNLAAISAADGSLTSWAPSTNSTVSSMVAAGSTIYVSGNFGLVTDSTGTQTRNALAAFDTAGKTLSWDPDAGAAGAVYGMALHGSRMYVGGSFTSLGQPGSAITESNLGVTDANNGIPLGWATNPPNPSSSVNTLDVSPDGSTLYVGGNYGQIGNPVVNRLGIAAVNTTSGAVDPNWDPADPANGGFIDDVAVGPTGTVYLVGDFFPNLGPPDPSMGFVTRYYAAELEPAGNGATGAATAFDPDLDSEAFSIARAADAVYLGGTFSIVNAHGTRPPQTRDAAGAADLAGGDALAWNPSPNGNVFALVPAADGSLYVGGGFTTMATGTASGFASFSPPPAATAPPTLQGTPEPGQTLTCTQGTWSGAQPQTYTTQLLYDGAPSGSPGATDYVIQPGDGGHTIGCTVTAHNRSADVTAAAANVTITAPPPGGGPSPPPGLAPPVFLKSANAYPQSGTVLVKLPGSKVFQTLTAPTQIPFGSIVDATRGRVRICTADAKGTVNCSDFYGGRFKLRQIAGAQPVTELVLVGGNFKACKRVRARRTVFEAKRPKSIRHLWGQGSGRFRTVGRFASATIRGTTWLTDDRCDGTLIRVKAGAVTVRDLVKGRSLALRAPRKYLAKAGRRRA